MNFDVKEIGKSIASFGRDNVAKMKSFFAGADARQFVNVGRFLATQYEGKSLGEHLVNGKSFNVTSVTIDGKRLPVKSFDLALTESSLKVWGCPSCGSAHGTNMGASRKANSEPDSRLLAANRWYYNPKTQALFTISATCWQTYVKDAGLAGRFVDIGKADLVAVAKPKVTPAVKPVVAVAPVPALVPAIAALAEVKDSKGPQVLS